jgi:hypothetical protein
MNKFFADSRSNAAQDENSRVHGLLLVAYLDDGYAINTHEAAELGLSDYILHRGGIYITHQAAKQAGLLIE